MFNKKNKFYYKLLFSIFSLSIFSPIFIVSCSKKNDNNNNDDNNNDNVDDNLLIGDKELKQLIIDKKIEVALNQEINISLNYFNNYKSNKNEIIKMFRLKFNDSINQSSFKLEIEQEPVFNEKDNNTISCKFRITNLENSKYVIYDWKSSYFNFSTDENYFQEVYENISRSLYLKEEFQETRIIDLFEEKSTILNRDFINTYIDKQRALVNTVGIDYELEIPSQNLKMNLPNYFRFKLSLFDQKTKQKIVLKNTSVIPSLNVNENQKDTFTILNQDDFNQTPTSFITSDHLGKLFIRPKSKVVEEAVEINVRLQGKVIINELDLSYFKNLVFGLECDFKRNNITNVFFSEDATITNLNNEIFKNNLIKEINLPNKVINYSNNCFDKNVIINTKINSIESLDQILDFDNSSTNPNLMLNYLDSEQKLEEFLDFLTRSKITRTNLKFNKIYLPTKFKYSDNLLNNYRLNCSEVILPTVNEFTNRFSYWTVEKVHIPSSIIKINKNIFPQSTNVTREFNEEILKLIQNKELNLNSFNSSSDIEKLDDYFFSFNSNPLEIQKIIFSKDIIQNFSYSLSSDWKFFFDNNNILEKQIVFNESVQKINVDFYNSLKTKNINIERKIYSEFEKNGVISQKTLYLEKFYGINTDVTNFKDYLTGYESYIETINTQNVTTIKESTFDSLDWTNININLDQIQQIENRAFYSCDFLNTEINLENLVSIGDYAFSGCNKIEQITLNNLTSIGNSAFYNCTQLRKITIPKIENLSSSAFSNCSNLTEINLENLVSIGDYAFYGCNKIEQITLNNLTSIGNSTFYNCTQLRKIIIPKIENLSSYAFYNCSNLIEINLENLVSIGDYAFYGCNKIEQITLNNLTSIGNRAFYNCTQLRKIIIPKIKNLSSSAFSNCSNLIEINLENLVSIGDEAFSGCNKIEQITLNNLTSIGNNAFDNCAQLTTIVSQNYLTSIGNSAFYNCNNLLNLKINEQTLIGTNSFSGCTKLDLSFNINLNNFDIEKHFGLDSQNFPDKFKQIQIDNSKIGYDPTNKILDLTTFDWSDLSSKNTLLLFSQQIKSSPDKTLEEVILPKSESINSKFKYIFFSLTINKLTWKTPSVKVFNESLASYFNLTTINSIDENFCVGMNSIPDSAFSNQLRNQKKINLMNVRNIGNYAFSGINAEFINTQAIKTIGNKSFSNRCKFNIPPNVQLEDDSFTTNWKELNNKDIVREQIFSNSDKFSQIYDQTTKTLDFTKITIYSPSDYENLKKYENISLYLLDGDVELLILPKIYNLTNDLYSNLGTISNIKFQNENQIIIKNSFNNTTILNKPSINETRIMLDEDAFFN